MISLDKYFFEAERRPPPSPEALRTAQELLGGALPRQLKELYQQTDGIQGRWTVTLFDVASLHERNQTYETFRYLPDFLYVGNDNGNAGVFISKSDDDPRVFVSDLGDQSLEGLKVLASSLNEWFEQGCPWADGSLGSPGAVEETQPDVPSGIAAVCNMSPMDQFQFIHEFNWDDDLKPVQDILGSPSCPLEAAVLAFWRGEGPSYLIGEQDRSTWLGPMMMSLSSAILEGKYALCGIRYDPVASEGLTRVNVYQYKKKGLPEIFFGPFGAG